MWSWTTIWHILHNPTYIGQRVWNKYDYSTGKKKKAAEELIIRADAHPAIIDRDTFYTVSAKGQERNASDVAFKSTGPSLYLLRGLLKCPDCGTNMVTGSTSKSSRGKSRYYHCGTYHRKGSKACNRNGVYKDKLELAVINTLIREFSLLGYTGSLEDEIRKFFDYQNREILFQLSRIEDDIRHLKKRIEITSKEKPSANMKGYIEEYIKEMESEIVALESQKSNLTLQRTQPQLSREQLQYLHDKLKAFITNIKTETPDQQHRLIKEFVISVMEDKLSNGFKLAYKLTVPSEFPQNTLTILEKTLYFSMDLQ